VINYLTSVAITGSIAAIFCLGVNVSWGWVGQLDLAFYAYVALGAYFTSVLELPRANHQQNLNSSYILGFNWPFIPAVAGATALGAVAAFIVGAIALRRLRGDYIAIITASTALALAAVLSQDSSLFGGYIGLYGLPQPFNGVLHLGPKPYSYFYLGLCLVCLGLVYVVLEALYRSPFGRSLRAIREDDVAAAAFGRKLYWLRLRAYALGGAVGAFGGALLANYLGAWNPSSWNLIEVTLLLSAVVVGGRANSRGVIIGAVLVLSAIPEVTRLVPIVGGNADVGPAIGNILAGLLIVAVLRFRPSGILRERKTVHAEPAPPTAELAAAGSPRGQGNSHGPGGAVGGAGV
jgi:branched-chain amino acid transport system permease protein